MLSEIKELYRRDRKLARQAAKALGYKIVIKGASSKKKIEKLTKDLAEEVVKDAVNAGYGADPAKVKEILASMGNKIQAYGMNYLKDLIKKAMKP